MDRLKEKRFKSHFKPGRVSIDSLEQRSNIFGEAGGPVIRVMKGMIR
jgi:hypothetical protein